MSGAPGPMTCPSLCVERSHPGREHDEAEHGCFCWDLCSMGPTCPAANAGLDRGCWRVEAGTEPVAIITEVARRLREVFRSPCDQPCDHNACQAQHIVADVAALDAQDQL